MKCFSFEAFHAAAHNVEKEGKCEMRKEHEKWILARATTTTEKNEFSRYLDHTQQQQQPEKSTHSRIEISPMKSGECFSIIEKEKFDKVENSS